MRRTASNTVPGTTQLVLLLVIYWFVPMRRARSGLNTPPGIRGIDRAMSTSKEIRP